MPVTCQVVNFCGAGGAFSQAAFIGDLAHGLER